MELFYVQKNATVSLIFRAKKLLSHWLALKPAIPPFNTSFIQNDSQGPNSERESFPVNTCMCQ